MAVNEMILQEFTEYKAEELLNVDTLKMTLMNKRGGGRKDNKDRENR